MNELVVILGWLGVYAPVGLGALGSALGVAIAGQAAIGAMLALVTGGLFFDLPLPLVVIGHEGGTVLVVLNGLRLLSDPIRRLKASVAGQALTGVAQPT